MRLDRTFPSSLSGLSMPTYHFQKEKRGKVQHRLEPYPVVSVRKDKNLVGFISGGHRCSNGTIVLETPSGSPIALIWGAKIDLIPTRKYSQRKL